ncbi:inactive peptidyl-prolyl cis-trans isomerase FKBP6-like [Diretmus argenteus]
MVDVGAYGKGNEGGTLRECAFGRTLQAGTLHIPPGKHLPGAPQLGEVPDVFVGDEAFPLQHHIMRPDPGHNLSRQQRIYNYRLPRAQLVAFGMLASRFCMYRQVIGQNHHNVEACVKATCILHNLLRSTEAQHPSLDHTTPMERARHQGANSSIGVVMQQRETSPFHRLGQQMEDILGDGGILKEVFQPGEGPPVPRNASVSIRFSAFLEYCDRPFDTNCNVKHPQMMKLGRDVTLAGLELGLLTMRKGEFSRFLFKPQYAYGEIGCPPFIPSAATVLYEIQVLDFLDSAQVDGFLELSVEEQNDVPLSTLLKVVNTCRSFGNRCFKQSRYYDAKDNYKQAMTLLGNKETENDVEREKINTELLPLYMNLSLSELRLERPHKALKYAIKALEVDPDNTKALYRCGQAYLETHDYKNAQGCLIKAQAKKPFDSDINNLLKKVAICYKDSLDKQKEMYSKMFKGFNHPMKM